MAHQDRIKHARELIKEFVHAEMSDEIKRLTSYALADLHFGPDHNGLDEDPGFSFERATIAISQWCSDNLPSELWVDLDCDDVLTRAPEGYEGDDGEWVEPFTEETVYFDRTAIRAATFGALAQYVS